MASKVIIFVCVQMLVFKMVYGQVIGRIGGLGSCGCSNILPIAGSCGCSNILPITEQILPKYVSAPSPCIYDQPTTIIQDSTVANNLANALQLLVVSNLLSNTLPLEPCAPVVSAPILSGPLDLLAPASLVSSPYGPLASLAPASLISPCGCGNQCGCGNYGGCGCGLGPYNVIY